MCGIAGIISNRPQNKEIMAEMLKTIHHRGPDHNGIFEHQNIILGHVRLSIIDLVTGDQPIFNEDRSLCIIYNGELYNYRELRSELIGLGHNFKTQSDTEVILHGYEEFGTEVFQRLNGMFVFCIYNLHNQELVIARDHFGIKPLHYFKSGPLLIFGSEQKSILKHPDFTSQLNIESLHYHLNLRYTQSDDTLFQGIKRLPPASYLIYKEGTIIVKKYWQLNPNFENNDTELEITDKINFHIKEAVRRQLISDVPIGVYLSGGMDSSAIVQKMYELGVPEINTFTLGFNEPTDEFDDARAIAEFFNTNHRTHSLDLNPLKDYTRVIWHAEEPKINLLQGYNMSSFVRPHVKVVLGGLGGDEIFAGYDIHKFIYPTQKWHRRIPIGLQKILGWKADFIYRIQNKSKTLGFDEYRRGIQMLLSIGNLERYYLILRNAWDFDDDAYLNIYQRDHANILLKRKKTVSQFHGLFDKVKEASPLDQVLLTEMSSKMVNDYLLVEDRMSMSHSVEERVPFLDIDLVKYAMSIPIRHKIKHNQTKHIFRNAMEPLLPKKIVKKKKWGFTVNPYLQFKKDLKSVAEKKLSKEFIEKQGIFNFSYLERILKHNPSPKLRWHYNYLWIVLGVAIWEDIFIRGKDLDDPIV